jgi:predicted nucleic acid-binding protein
VIVVDTSVYVALMNKEDVGHEVSRRWFESVVRNGERLVAPVIIMAEAGAAITRGLNDPAFGQQVVEQISQLSFLELIPIDYSLAELAAGIAVNYRIRGCDALFVALAQQRSEPLVTLDKQQRERGQAAVTVIEPQ